MDTRTKILDIAMNLNRVGNWAADDYFGKRDRIKTFLANTTGYIKDLNSTSFSPTFAPTFSEFKSKYVYLEKEGLRGPKDTSLWAENMMTWGNILTHRSKLLS